MPAFIDLTGQKFGRWTVLARGRDTAYKHPRWVCRCECGGEGLVKGQSLREGQSQSCGCYNVDRHRELCVVRNTTHWRSTTRTFNIWVNLRQRCLNPNNPKFPRYGGRGIRVCERWNSFENFVADMGEAPTDLSIDRINVNGDYEPGNCRWATAHQQQNNRSNSRLNLMGF